MIFQPGRSFQGLSLRPEPVCLFLQLKSLMAGLRQDAGRLQLPLRPVASSLASFCKAFSFLAGVCLVHGK